MATPREIYEKDLGKNLRVHRTYCLTVPPATNIEIIAGLSYDFDAGAKYASIFFEAYEHASMIIEHFIRNINKILDVEKDVQTSGTFCDGLEVIPSTDLVFTGRLLVYTPSFISSESRLTLSSLAKNFNIQLIIREGRLLMKRIEMEKPLAFISHDSRDKSAIVKELAVKLHSMFCTVWYDEFSLIPGQSLRESIEEGLKKCRKCVIILSPNFLENKGWTKAEFDSVFTREIIEKKNLLLPIWHNVSVKDVYNYCPRLADRVGISSQQEIGEIARQVIKGLNL